MTGGVSCFGGKIFVAMGCLEFVEALPVECLDNFWWGRAKVFVAQGLSKIGGLNLFTFLSADFFPPTLKKIGHV